MKVRSALAALLVICVSSSAAAQQDPAEDSRTQYPPFLANSYFSFSPAIIGYLFGERQLQPGFEAESIDKPRLAFRIDLFGHHFTRYFSVQATYMRPIEYVEYHNVNGNGDTMRVSNAYAGLTFVFHAPLTERLSAYGEAGGGITSRSGFSVDNRVALQPAHYTAGMLGAGFSWHATPKVDLLLGVTYTPGRRAFDQPSTRLYSAGIQYQMRPLPPDVVEENRRSGYAFPANIGRFGISTNHFSYGPNNFFSHTVPIFFGGDIETRYGLTFDYQRNVFHTKKWFAFDLGASLSVWKSNGIGEGFRTLSGYPLLRFFLFRGKATDLYFGYSVAGPTFITKSTIDGQDTGARFTFQDFMSIGGYIGPNRRMNVELGLKHFSNGNLFPNNTSIKVPLTLTLGMTF